MSRERSAVVFTGMRTEQILPRQNLETDVPDVITRFSAWHFGNVGSLGLISKSN